VTDIARERAFLSAQGLDMITRETWGAVQSYTSARDVSEPVEGFVLHISVTIDHGDLTGNEHADMRTIERIGQERFGIGLPYNAAIFDTGRLYEGQPLTRRGAHTVDDKNIGYKSTGTSRSMNFWWRAIVLPQMVDDDVTSAQVDKCARWAAAQIRAGYAKRDAIWIGHRDVAWKACPGDTGYARLPQIRALTEHYVVNGLTPSQSTKKDDKMYAFVKSPDGSPVYLTDLVTKRHMRDLNEYNGYLYVLRSSGAALFKNGEIDTWPQSYIDNIPTVDGDTMFKLSQAHWLLTGHTGDRIGDLWAREGEILDLSTAIHAAVTTEEPAPN